MKTFLLPCRCSASVVVGPGQAGGRTTCSACGRQLEVPRLGELGRLAPVAIPAAGAGRVWTPAHACLLGGLAVAAIGWLAAIAVNSPPESAMDAGTIRAAVATARDGDIYKAWQSFARSGVARPPMADEQRLQQVAISLRAVATVLKIIAGLGAAVACGGGVVLATRRPGCGL